MATSFGAATASVTENAQKSSAYLPLCHRHFLLRANSNKVSVRLYSRPKLRLSSKGLHSGWHCLAMVKAQSNEVRFSYFESVIVTLLKKFVAFKVAVAGSSTAAASNSDVSPTEDKDVKFSNESPATALASEESISEFITQVSSLVKLVDSKDIVELKMKQLDCEILIRKKEALPPPPSPSITYVQSQPQPAVPPPVSSPSPVPAAAPSPAPSPPKALPSKSSHPPLKCPMAGTFYRSPAPGEPPFVKVGDKVQKGQVLCIIEAMKLMNEIEADRSGTIVEIIAEDGKSVSVDTPLFVIEP